MVYIYSILYGTYMYGIITLTNILCRTVKLNRSDKPVSKLENFKN